MENIELKIAGVDISATKVNNDKYGNPRYVVHFTDILDLMGSDRPHYPKFQEALRNAKKVGGKTYRAKWYGGGIVFTTYNLRDTLTKLVGGVK